MKERFMLNYLRLLFSALAILRFYIVDWTLEKTFGNVVKMKNWRWRYNSRWCFLRMFTDSCTLKKYKVSKNHKVALTINLVWSLRHFFSRNVRIVQEFWPPSWIAMASWIFQPYNIVGFSLLFLFYNKKNLDNTFSTKIAATLVGNSDQAIKEKWNCRLWDSMNDFMMKIIDEKLC